MKSIAWTIRGFGPEGDIKTAGPALTTASDCITIVIVTYIPQMVPEMTKKATHCECSILLDFDLIALSWLYDQVQVKKSRDYEIDSQFCTHLTVCSTLLQGRSHLLDPPVVLQVPSKLLSHK